MKIGDQGRGAFHCLLTEVMQPLPAHESIACGGNCSEDGYDEGETTPAESSGALPRPMYKPDQGKGGSTGKYSASHTDGGDLELVRRTSRREAGCR